VVDNVNLIKIEENSLRQKGFTEHGIAEFKTSIQKLADDLCGHAQMQAGALDKASDNKEVSRDHVRTSYIVFVSKGRKHQITGWDISNRVFQFILTISLSVLGTSDYIRVGWGTPIFIALMGIMIVLIVVEIIRGTKS